MPTKTLGEYIATRRKQLHYTQEELSKRLKELGVDRAATTLANWEAGRGDVPIEIIPTLARALNEPSPVTLYDLAGVLENIPGYRLIRLLNGASADDIDKLMGIAEILLHEEHSQK